MPQWLEDFWNTTGVEFRDQAIAFIPHPQQDVHLHGLEGVDPARQAG